jgi:colicin import membrane protein
MQGIRLKGLSKAIAVATLALVAAHMAPNSRATEARQDAVVEQAEGLAEAASKEFSVILERQRVAQLTPKSQAPAPAKHAEGASSSPLSWLRHSSQQFQALMGMLAAGSGRSQPWDPVADAEKKAAVGVSLATKPKVEPPAKQAPPPAEAANPAAEAKIVEQRKLAETRRAEAEKAEESPKVEQAKRAAKAALDARKAADVKAAEDARKAAEAKRLADAKAAADARKAAAAKAAEDARKAADAKKIADAKAAENARKAAEAKKLADTKAAETKAAEAKRAEEARRAAEAQRIADLKKAEEASAAAAAKKGEAEKQAKAAAAAKRADAEKQAKAAKEAAEAMEAKRLAEAKTAKLAEEKKQPSPPAEHPGEVNAACPDAGGAITVPGWYVVQSGDTLSEIAQRHYGRALRYYAIRAANRSRIHNSNMIYACQRIYLPQLRT